ncbi:MAG TPA: hypothetical protein VN803_03620, partial [Gemmatimonadales bacterium]|nr:hypothetical protein [Gemmatimonadales bacterium]
MGSVPALLKSRWATGLLVGDATHSCVVRIRPGYMDHLYQDPDQLDTSPGPLEQVFPIIWKGNNGQPWQGQWVPTGDWITLENVQSANQLRDFTSKGGATLTVVIDNIAFNDQTGAGGLYHTIDRGWYSPTRGVKVVSRPSLWAENAWTDVLNGGYQIDVWEGYGIDSDVVPVLSGEHWSAPSASRTFVGLIEGCDLDSHPDHITLTARDNVLLTDQRVMGWNKAREIQSPVTFADRKKTLGEVKEFGSIVVSSGTVTADEQLGAVWSSDVHTDPSHTEWIEIHLPAGHYEQFYAALPFDGEDMYVSLYARGGACRMDTVTVVPDGWVDLSLGTVPVDGEPYIALHPDTVANPSQRWSIGGHTWDLGDDSVLRLSFTSLAADPGVLPVAGVPTTAAYRAGTVAFYAFKFGTDPLHPPPGTPPVNALHWILVEDAADVIRTILLWAGYHEMDVQNFGWTLQAPMVWGQDKFFSDVIDDILAQGNNVFFLDAPTDHDMSIGVPVFRPQSATRPPSSSMLQIQDSHLLEALQVKEDMSNLPYVMRYRGAVSPTGTALPGIFGDLVKRYIGTYWPPWSGHDYTNLQGGNFTGGYPQGRVAGVRRHFSQTD